MSDLVDLHCHVLAGLDDGPESVEEASALAQALGELGFAHLHPTPHQTAHRWAPDPEACQTAAKELRGALERAGCTVQVHRPAGENMWDDLFLSRQPDHSFPRYAGDRSFLLEFPPSGLPPLLSERLFELRMGGLLPVIAHVERYRPLCDDPSLLGGRAAVLMNLGSLAGGLGWGHRTRLRRMVAEGAVHALATDAHGLQDAREAAAGLKWLRKSLGEGAVRRLLVEGPQQILAGEIPDTA